MSRLFLVLLGIVAFSGAAGADDGKPNVVLIAVDDLNDWIGPNGVQGNAQAITPNLDRLARRGIYFTNAHTAVPVCMVPWLTDVSAPRERPAVTTWHYDNHSVRSERYRYIRYRDGSEELYDHANDPSEHINLADRVGSADTLAAHRRWLPKQNASTAQDPSADALGKRYQLWSEEESQIPDWLK